MELTEEKGQLRTLVRAKRKAIPQDTRSEAEEAFAQRVLELLGIHSSACIGVYQAVGSELDVTPALKALRSEIPSARITYPVIVGEGLMIFAEAKPEESPRFITDPMGVFTAEDDFAWIEPEELDLLLAPGIAFDQERNRLGQGGGFYDRLLPRLRKDCLVVGVAFDEQIVDAVPHEPHDRPMDYIVTPTRIIGR